MIKQMKKKIAICLGTLAAVAGTLFGCENQLPPIDVDEKSEYCVTYDLPEDNDPTLHTGLENLGYMAKVLSETENYKVEMTSDVVAKIVISYTQHVRSVKNYADGVMTVTDISTSSLVNTCSQTCFMGNKAVMRKPVSKNPKDWDEETMEWSNEKPDVYTIKEYMPLYGLAGTEFSAYLINEDTLVSSSEVTRTAEGYYSQTFTFDTETSSAYYRARMKQMGGLADYPDMHSIEATYVFNDRWQVISSHYVENYGFKLNAVISSDHAVATSDSYYTYGDAKVPDYYSFFYQFKDSESVVVPDDEPEATDYLLEAFSPVLAGGATYSINGLFRDANITGDIYLGLDPLELIARLGDITIGYVDEKLYLGYHDFAGRITIERLIKSLEDKLTPSEEGSDDMLGFLENFADGELVKNGEEVTLCVSLDFEDTKIPLKFVFREEDSITLDRLEVSLSVEGEPLYLVLTEGGSKPTVVTNETNIDACLDELFDFVYADRMGATISYADQNFSVKAEVGIGDVISADFAVQAFSVSLKGRAAIAEEVVYLDLFEVDGEPCTLKVKTQLENLTSLLTDELGSTEEQSKLADIVYALFKIDYQTVLEDVREENGTLCVSLNIDPLLNELVDLSVGTISLRLFETMAKVEVKGVEVLLHDEGYEFLPEGEYTDISDAVSGVAQLIPFIEGENYYIDLKTLWHGDSAFRVNANAKIWNDGGWKFAVNLKAFRISVGLFYDGARYCINLPDCNFRILASESELKYIADEIAAMFGDVNLGTAVETSFSIAKLLNGLTLLPDEDSLFAFRMDLSSVFDSGFVDVKGTENGISATGANLMLDGTRLTSLEMKVSDGKNQSVQPVGVEYTVYPDTIYSVLDFLDSDAYELNAQYQEIGLHALVNTKGNVNAELTIANKTVYVTHYEETVYLKADDVSLSATLDAIGTALKQILPDANEEEIQTSVNLIEVLCKFDPSAIRVTGMSEGEFELTVALGNILSAFGIAFDAPELTLAYQKENKVATIGVYGAVVTLTKTTEEVSAPEGEYVSIDEFLKELDRTVTLEINTTVKTEEKDLIESIKQGQDVFVQVEMNLSALVEINFEEELVLSAVLTVQTDDGGIVYVTLIYDGDELTLSFGNFGIRLSAADFEDLLLELEQTGEEIVENVNNAPEGAKNVARDIVRIINALNLIGEIDVDGIFDSIQSGEELDAEQLIQEIAGLLDGLGFTLSAERETIYLCVSPIEIASARVENTVVAIRPTKGEVSANEYFIKGEQATLWEKSDVERLLATVRASSSLVKSEYFTLGFAFTVLNDSIEYNAYEHVRFTANGEVSVYTGDDLNSGAVQIKLTLLAKNKELDGDLYMTFLSYDGDGDGTINFYVTASQYPEGSPDRVPLRLEIQQSEVRKMVETIFTIAGFEFDYYDGVLSDDLLARIEAFATGELNLRSALIDLLVQTGESAPDGVVLNDVLNDYLKRLSFEGNKLTVQLDGKKLFGDHSFASSDLNDLTLTVETADDVISKFTLDHLYLVSSDHTELVRATLTLSNNAFTLNMPSASELAGYVKADGVYDMLEMMINSATHSAQDGYRLNSDFVIEGSVSMKLSFITLATVDIGIRVHFIENGAQIDVRIVNGRTTSDMTIRISDRESRVFVRRNANGTIIYQEMSLAAFSSNILDEIMFLINVDLPLSDGSESTNTSHDYGNYLISFTPNTDGYTLKLNGASLTDGVLSDIGIGIKEKAQDGVKVLDSLTVETKLMSIITIKGALNYVNPGSEHANVPVSGQNGYTESVNEEVHLMLGKLAEDLDETEIAQGQAYTVTFKVNGQTVGTEQYVPGSDRELSVKLSDYESEGLIAAWEPDLNAISSNTTVNLVYLYEVTMLSDYAVEEFEWNGTAYEGRLTYKVGTTLILPEIELDSEDRLFDGWVKDGEIVTSVSDCNATVYARAKRAVAVNFISKYAIDETYTAAGDVYKKSVIFELTESVSSFRLADYTPTKLSTIGDSKAYFLGWTLNGVDCDENTVYLADKRYEFVAVWLDPLTVTLESEYAFNANRPETEGDYRFRTQELYAVNDIYYLTAPDSAYNVDGHRFVRWELITEGVDEANGGYVVTKELLFRAVWEKYYVVKYTSSQAIFGDDRTQYEMNVQLSEGESFTLEPISYEVEGLRWKEWNILSGTYEMQGDRLIPTSNMEIEAVYEWLSYELTLHANGKTWTIGNETLSDTRKVTFANGVYALPVPECTENGYVFLGWTTYVDGAWTNISRAYETTSGTAIYATWVKETVTLNVNVTKKDSFLIRTVNVAFASVFEVSDCVGSAVLKFEWTINTSSSHSSTSFNASKEIAATGLSASHSVSEKKAKVTYYCHARATLIVTNGTNQYSVSSATVSKTW